MSVHIPPGDACVEAGQGQGVIGIRDSQLGAASPVLQVSPAAWTAFLSQLGG